MSENKLTFNSMIKSMGLVFGDIGTSPIYTLTVVFLTLQVNTQNVISILSLIIWTLLLVVTVQYTWLAMSLSKGGEGGAIVLNEILQQTVKSSRAVVFFSFLTYVGISLLIGDSVITPAISILSAIEGLRFIEILHNIPQSLIIFITIVIAVSLFSVQKKGIENITQVFGPIMLIWFLALGLSGLASIITFPEVLKAFNPLCGIGFILHNGISGFFILSEVILCATGAEALYADMGHLGRKPITGAWFIVCIFLIINYLGQGAFLILHPNIKNILFSMISTQMNILYIPFLVVSILATIIASQAMISGLYSIIYQGINTRIIPMFKVNYTSEKINSQIYIGSANWFLLCSVIIIILIFKESSNLASAYGLAVTGTIAITCTMISTIFFLRKKYFHFAICLMLIVIDFSYFIATCSKIHTGAYWSIIIALIPFSIILLYVKGQKTLYHSLSLMNKGTFLKKYNKMYATAPKIRGTALFFARGIEKVPPYIVQTMFTNNIIYTKNIFVQINKTSEAKGISHEYEMVAPGLHLLKVYVGYMQFFKLEILLKRLNIREKAIFYGIEEIETNNFFWHIFAIIKKITPTFVSFYKLPVHKIHGVVTQIRMR